MKTSLYGIINIGASAFRMIISELNAQGMKEIDYLIKPLRLGMDTFSQGFISLEHVKQAAHILCGFKRKLEEYGIKNYKAVCTSGVREAGNKDFFIDYIKIHSGIDLEILEPSEEVYIKYLAARSTVANFSKMEKEGIVFANIASGNVTLSVTKSGGILYSGALPYGSLRLRQMFLHIDSSKRFMAFDQYAENMVSTVAGTIGKNAKIKNLVGSGSSITLIERIFKPAERFIYAEDLKNLYKRTRTYKKQELMEELNLREDEAEVLIPTLCTYIHLLKFAGTDRFHFSKEAFPTTLAMFYTNRLKDSGYYKIFKNTIISIGKRYGINICHAKRVAKFTKKLFDDMADLHSLGKNEYLILETAALLYQVGNYIDAKNTAYNSFFIIKSISIPGWSGRDIFLTACAVYYMDMRLSDKAATFNDYLSVNEKLLVNKLACLLRTAAALDAGKTGAIEDFEVSIHNNMVLIDAKTAREPFLELTAFDRQKSSFEATFGIPISITTKVNYD